MLVCGSVISRFDLNRWNDSATVYGMGNPGKSATLHGATDDGRQSPQLYPARLFRSTFVLLMLEGAAMGLDGIRNEISYMRRQISRRERPVPPQSRVTRELLEGWLAGTYKLRG